ncbi:MAG: PilC/PilY family type IV pilus protein [Desulfobacterales bacterium]|jgi:type IV pilus assembly protein PilY1|nr:PilC/PilY family type IV pilus protein [Desulfobacterales bacterium]
MFYFKKYTSICVRMIVLAAVMACLPAAAIADTCDCTDTADPPFLAAGVDPNLLLIIDNSASMYDMAYQKNDTVCFDDTYDHNVIYSGYFDGSSWYAHNSGSNRFETTVAGACAGAAGTTAYSNAYVCVVTRTEVVGADTIIQVDAFKATGNFLNWATASKFDIQKQILTGGKYTAGELESEGRGCSGNRFIKEVGLTSGATAYKLVLGIRTDYDDTDGVDTTLIDIFQITQNGFVPEKCQAAIDLMMGDPTGFGQVKQSIIDCMEYDAQNPYQQPGEHDKQALINSLHDCWYLNKQGDWPGGGAQGFNFENWCADVYTRDDPRTITKDNAAYVCYGNGTTPALEGFIGECWNPPGVCHDVACVDRALQPRERCNGGVIEYCTNWNSGKSECKKEEDWVVVQECDGGGAVGGWKSDAEIVAMGRDWTNLDECITAARERFCGYIEVPQVVDPSDLQMSSGETWNLPAMLMSQGAAGQLGTPLATFQARIATDAVPSGLLEIYGQEIKIGAMAFNYDGSKSECAKPFPYVTYDCDDPDNKDGTYLVQPIGAGADHLTGLKSNINNIKAKSWTPLAEAVFNAIGYYTQRADLRLNPTDFPVDAAPISEYCEKNNLLLITDGASTADLNPIMVNLAGAAGVKDEPDVDNSAGCGDLYGSSYLDDLTHYAWKGNIFSGSPYAESELYQNILTFLVVAGTPRDEGVGECNPKTLLENAAFNGGSEAPLIAADPAQLKQQIESVLRTVMKRAAAGSAASVIAATRGGEGAVYQAIFWPHMDDPSGKPEVTWTGEVHALLVDAYGRLYEDDGDKALTDADQRVVFFFDEANGATMACYGEVNAAGVCNGTVKSLHDVNYLWSAAEWLAGIGDADIDANRAVYISDEKKRYIFTWNDLNNNGAADANEMLPFVPAMDWAAQSVVPAAGAPNRPAVPLDFGMATDAGVDAIVSWIRGKDNLADDTVRKRQVPTPPNFNITGSPANITWRLVDIIHSTPTAVGRPMDNYHLLYRDEGYAKFYEKYQHRRNVIYFGGNDGLLHAVNGGFYDESTQAFCLSPGCAAVANAPLLGAELWAYAPYNLLPHLRCLTEKNYVHKYFVDLKPRIFDVRIFTPDADHPEGWGTILIAGMRIGGGKVSTSDITDSRQFVSSYVVMDITNPEIPPVLLGELTFDPATSAELGHTVAVPAVVPMKEGNVTKWYLVVGSGPTDVDSDGGLNWGREGTSNQKPRIGVFPLDKLTTGSKVFRIPAVPPDAGSAAGSHVLATSGDGMVSDIISVDYDLVPDYRVDALYFGTIEGKWAAKGGSWDGKLYRWVTNADSRMTAPHEWGKSTFVLGPPGVMFEPGRPISAAPSVGWDGDSFWVYFGTGRFMHKDDKTDVSSNGQESYYGIKEPMDCNGNFTWRPVTNANALIPPSDLDAPGTRKLLRIDQILVQQAEKPEAALLSCEGGGVGCLPAGVTTFKDMVDYIAGTGCVYDENKVFKGYSGTDGWYLNFSAPRERNLGQATLLGGLLTFTTYQPFDDVCRPEGQAYLYALYYQSGTAWYQPVFSEGIGLSGDDPPNVINKLDIGRGLATTPNLHVGRQSGDTAFVQTSTGAIVEINRPTLPIKTMKSGRMSWRSE